MCASVESDEFDPRDLQRVRSDLELVAKFARQQRGDHDNALKQMVSNSSYRYDHRLKYSPHELFIDSITEMETFIGCQW